MGGAGEKFQSLGFGLDNCGWHSKVYDVYFYSAGVGMNPPGPVCVSGFPSEALGTSFVLIGIERVSA